MLQQPEQTASERGRGNRQASVASECAGRWFLSGLKPSHGLAQVSH